MRQPAKWLRPGTRRVRLALLLSFLILTACTATPPSAPNPTSASGRSQPARAALRQPARQTTVLPAEPGPALAAATSAALFDSAPAVIVAVRGNSGAVASAGELAVALGVPALLLPTTRGDAAAAKLVRQELRRLAPQAVLAVGSQSSKRAEAVADAVPVYPVGLSTGSPPEAELPAELPAIEPPPPSEITVLVNKADADSAAAATSRAAGADVVAINGTDPRADPAAIETFHAEPPGAVLALGAGFEPAERLRRRLQVAVNGEQLPDGGQAMFPGRRLVCLYGHPGVPALGALGEQGVAASIARAERLAGKYDAFSDVPVVPALEIIATVAHREPGRDGDFSGESSVEELRPWVERAAEAGVYVLLDLQPGRADALAQAKSYKELLRMPHVGLALDPEWELDPNQQPLRRIGSMSAAEINRVSAWLAELTARNDLPQKLLVVHQFKLSMIQNEAALDTSHDAVTLLIHMDGQGTTAQKEATWQRVVAGRPDDSIPMGWKNFYDEDVPMLGPEQTMGYEPSPMMISYQ